MMKYDNKELENKYRNALKTKLDIENYAIFNDLMKEKTGESKRILTRGLSGGVDTVSIGEGNTQTVEIYTEKSDYEVVNTPYLHYYYDKEIISNPQIVEATLKDIENATANEWKRKAIEEYNKANTHETAIDNIENAPDEFINNISAFGEEERKDLHVLINPATLDIIKKNLKDELKYPGRFICTGCIGTVYDIPLIINSIVPKDEIIFAHKEAVTLSVNERPQIKQKHDNEKKGTKIYVCESSIVALTDANKVRRIALPNTINTTISTCSKGQRIIAGVATTGAIVRVYINKALKNTTVAKNYTYYVELDKNLVAGNVVKVVAKKDGQVSSFAEQTVS